MSIQSDFQTYTNSLGFVSNTPNGSSGNDLLFSAEAAITRKKYGAWNRFDQTLLINNINMSSKIAPGLYGRPGWRQDQEAPDDYYGLATLDPSVANDILTYGQQHWWYFKTVMAPTWYDPLFIRFPGLIAHVKWCAGKKPNIFLRLFWCMSVALCSATSQDSWLLNNILTTAAGDKGFIEKIATKIYKYRLKKIWGTLGNVYAAYFNNKNHPLAIYNQ